MKKLKLTLRLLLAAMLARMDRLSRPRGSVALANELAGRDPTGVTTGQISANATVPVTNTYIRAGKSLVYMIGTDSTATLRTFIQCSGAATKAAFPIGISDDAPYQAGDWMDVRQFGAEVGTEVGISAGSITDLDWVYAAANGLVGSCATATGSPTVWVIGKANKTVTGIGQEISFVPSVPFLLAITTAAPNTYAVANPL
jgi:hypothetical protein